jgi:hypothetical protein
MRACSMHPNLDANELGSRSCRRQRAEASSWGWRFPDNLLTERRRISNVGVRTLLNARTQGLSQHLSSQV